jgi:hypothetical protein
MTAIAILGIAFALGAFAAELHIHRRERRACGDCGKRIARHRCDWCEMPLCDGCNFGTETEPLCESCHQIVLDERLGDR